MPYERRFHAFLYNPSSINVGHWTRSWSIVFRTRHETPHHVRNSVHSFQANSPEGEDNLLTLSLMHRADMKLAPMKEGASWEENLLYIDFVLTTIKKTLYFQRCYSILNVWSERHMSIWVLQDFTVNFSFLSIFQILTSSFSCTSWTPFNRDCK
jgi:nitroreductase